MNIVTLDEIYAHTRVDNTAEESLLTLYADAAEETMLNYIGRTLDELYDEYNCVPTPLKQAVLLLIDNSYTNRSPVSVTNMYTIPYAFEHLVRYYMKLS